jgi:hypothetical protein
MAEKERERPSLELPSLGFGRKRKQHEPATEPVGAAPPPPPEPTAPAAPEAESTTGPEPATGPRFTLPALGGVAASVVTGILVGVVAVGLVWGSTRLCELARGTSSCGTPGWVLLIAVVAAAALLGKYLLQALGVAEPASTSVLGVGVTTAVTLLFLGGQLFEWWMVIAVPIVAAGGYALSHRVTTAVVGPIDDNMHR